MKKMYVRMKSFFSRDISTQEMLIDFIENEKNIEKATEGSMQKRLDLIKRVELHKRSA